MSERKTIYATHPLRPEIKAEAIKAGLKIIDAAFAPEGERIMDGQTGLPLDLKADEVPSMTEAQIRKLNKAGLIAFLAANEIEAASDATNAVLIDLALPFAAQE